ncbi:IclR family transcriptional regulator [Pseudonocardia xishanensis]|uniref:IclR family transcriptional regulator C-terminal domain-containing protein n=1 Tax=Pseudonocardia xishanensis TaxID=630995 RepID=A0ABP8RW80_9PSEU
MSGAGQSTPTRIRSVTRAVRLLMLVAELAPEDRVVARLARELGTTVPTTYHLLNTLLDAKLLSRDPAKRYRLGVAVDILVASHAREAVAPPELVAPLRLISETTGEAAYLSAWRGGETVILATRLGTHTVQVAGLRPGYSGAANARASGKVLLAFAEAAERDLYLELHPLESPTARAIATADEFQAELGRVTERGYALEIEEFAAGVACMAVPVLRDGRLVASYTISAPVERLRRRQAGYLACLREAADAAVAGWSTHPNDGE